MYMKRKVLINKFKKYKNLNFHKNGLGPLYNWGGGGGGWDGGVPGRRPFYNWRVSGLKPL